jgi:hypothetical protein
MVYFQIKGLGYNCGYIKHNCSSNSKSCIECVRTRLKEMGFELPPNFEIFEIESQERDSRIEQEQIWQKFLNVLNIKHILIIDKESGLNLLNYAASGVDIDANLLSGFIQANITFSEFGDVIKHKSGTFFEFQFYEFQYKNFNILLKDGNLIRLCLILDNKASDELKNNMFQFLEMFETSYHDELLQFRETGMINLEEMIDDMVHSFNIYLVFPMIIAHSIPPHELEYIKQNLIQKAIFNLAKELLTSKPFFFINNMLHRLKKIVEIEDSIVLFNIYQLLEKKIIIPTPLETIASNVEILKSITHQKDTKLKPLSPIIINEEDADDIKAQLENLSEDAAKKMMKTFIKKAKIAEKDLAYQVSKSEYRKALTIAKELEFLEDSKKISEYLFNLDHRSKQIELEFVIEMAENAEKKGDFINSINNYQKALKIIEGFLVYNNIDPRTKKFKRKIQKLRELI